MELQTVCLFFGPAHPVLIPDVWSARRGAEMQMGLQTRVTSALRAHPAQKPSIAAAHQDRQPLKAIKEVVYHLAEGVNWQFSTSPLEEGCSIIGFSVFMEGMKLRHCATDFFFIGLLFGTEALKSRVLLSGLFLLLVLAPFQTKATQKIGTDH